MARNRKTQSTAGPLVPAVKAILLCMLLGGSAVGYVLQKNQLYELGRQMLKREGVLDRLKAENNLRAAQLAKMQIPQRLSERVKEQNLGLIRPQPGQWITIVEPPLQARVNRVETMLMAGK